MTCDLSGLQYLLPPLHLLASPAHQGTRFCVSIFATQVGDKEMLVIIIPHLK